MVHRKALMVYREAISIREGGEGNHELHGTTNTNSYLSWQKLKDSFEIRYRGVVVGGGEGEKKCELNIVMRIWVYMKTASADN